jgi:hypothetical protein
MRSETNIISKRMEEMNDSFTEALPAQKIEREKGLHNMEKVIHEHKEYQDAQMKELETKFGQLQATVDEKLAAATSSSSSGLSAAHASALPPAVAYHPTLVNSTMKEWKPLSMVYGSFAPDADHGDIEKVGTELVEILPEGLKNRAAKPYCPSTRAVIGKVRFTSSEELLNAVALIDAELQRSPRAFNGNKIWVAVERHPSVGARRRVLATIKDMIYEQTNILLDIDTGRLALSKDRTTVLHIDRASGNTVKRKAWDSIPEFKEVNLNDLVKTAVMQGTVIQPM